MLHGAGSTVSASGSDITFTLNVSFKNLLAGANNLLVTASQVHPWAGWHPRGTWNVPVCSFTLESSTADFPILGGAGSVNLSAAAPTCYWLATPNVSWLTVTSAESGTGAATITYSVDANPSSTPRTGTLTIGARTFTVTQAGSNPSSCRLYLDGATGWFGGAGGKGRVIVTMNQTPCSWEASSDSDWISITSPASFSASGSVLYTVAPSGPGWNRVGHLTVAGQTVTITQLGDCSYTVDVASVPAPWWGTQAAVSLTASQPNCGWTSYSDQNWAGQYPQSGTGSATIQYTIYPSANTGGRSANLYVGGNTVEVIQDPNPGPEDERFVNLMYFGFLGRLPTAQELSGQVAAIQGGGIAKRRDLAVGLFNSTEFNNAGRFIAGLYVGILGRDAEYTGWLFQRNAYLAGLVNQQQLAANFLNSVEYHITYGTPANEQFVRLLYQNVLRRTPSTTELNTQLALLLSGTSRTQMALNFLNSTEFRQNSGPALTAFLQYACLLNRDAEQWERDYWADKMRTGAQTVESVFYDFINSDELRIHLQ